MLEKKEVFIRYINMIKNNDDIVIISLRTTSDNTNKLLIINSCYGSALDSYHFSLVIDEHTRFVQNDIP